MVNGAGVMELNVLYDPGVFRRRIKIVFESDRGITVLTEGPVPFPDFVKVKFVDCDKFLYARRIKESATITDFVDQLQTIDFAAIMCSAEPAQKDGCSKAVISREGYFDSFEFTLLSPETNANAEVKRVHHLLKELFAHIGMETCYDYDAWRKK
jgi:hypothetical protein